MCGLRGSSSTQYDDIPAVKIHRGLKATKNNETPAVEPNRAQRGIVENPESMKVKGWGYNAWSVPMPTKEELRLRAEREKTQAVNRNGDPHFSMPDAHEVASGNITTPSNPRRKGAILGTTVPIFV